MCALLCPFEIEHVKLAARFKDAPDRAYGRPLLIRGDVVEHEGGEHTVEGPVGIRKLIAKPPIELDRDRCACRLTARSSECFRVGIESNDIGPRIEAV